jgi:hypothetical protein
MAYAEVIRNTKTFELENLGKFLYKVTCKWGNKIEKLVYIGEKEIL